MIHLSWDWTIFAGIVIAGFLCGYLVLPNVWPAREAIHQQPPHALAFAVALTRWATFFGPLFVLRLVSGDTAELQATVLNLSFVVAGAVGLRVHRP